MDSGSFLASFRPFPVKSAHFDRLESSTLGSKSLYFSAEIAFKVKLQIKLVHFQTPNAHTTHRNKNVGWIKMIKNMVDQFHGLFRVGYSVEMNAHSIE